MGRIDVKTKEYMKKRERFAAMFNFLIYDGKPVIKPENLTPLDSTEVAIIDSNGVEIPVQKVRDAFMHWKYWRITRQCTYCLEKSFSLRFTMLGLLKTWFMTVSAMLIR